MMDQLLAAARRLETMTKIRDALANALTSDQQKAISEKIIKDESSFLDWLKGDEGRMAARDLANKFISAK